MEVTVRISGAQQTSVERIAVCDTKLSVGDIDFMRIPLVPWELASCVRKRVSLIASRETRILNLYGDGNHEGHEIDPMKANHDRNQISGSKNFVTSQT